MPVGSETDKGSRSGLPHPPAISSRLLWGPATRLGQLPDKLQAVVVRQLVQRAGGYRVGAIPTAMHERELRMLFKLARSCPPNAVVLEIGSYLGASSCYLAAGLSQSGGRLICVDTWQNDAMSEGRRDTFAAFIRQTTNFGAGIKVVRKRSTDLCDLDIPPDVHLVFIDGDHSYEGAKSDFELIQRWLAKGGIVAFHDSNSPRHPGVSRVIGEALASGRWMAQGLELGLLWIKEMQQAE